MWEAPWLEKPFSSLKMTAAGMSMHMAMMNARAASNQKSGDKKPDSGSIWLTEDEIREIRQESVIENSKKSEYSPSAENELEDPNDLLPKCSYCCLVM